MYDGACLENVAFNENGRMWKFNDKPKEESAA